MSCQITKPLYIRSRLLPIYHGLTHGRIVGLVRLVWSVVEVVTITILSTKATTKSYEQLTRSVVGVVDVVSTFFANTFKMVLPQATSTTLRTNGIYLKITTATTSAGGDHRPRYTVSMVW